MLFFVKKKKIENETKFPKTSEELSCSEACHRPFCTDSTGTATQAPSGPSGEDASLCFFSLHCEFKIRYVPFWNQRLHNGAVSLFPAGILRVAVPVACQNRKKTITHVIFESHDVTKMTSRDAPRAGSLSTCFPSVFAGTAARPARTSQLTLWTEF